MGESVICITSSLIWGSGRPTHTPRPLRGVLTGFRPKLPQRDGADRKGFGSPIGSMDLRIGLQEPGEAFEHSAGNGRPRREDPL